VALVAIAATDIWWLDPLAAAGLAFWLGWEGLHLVGRAFAGLMDKRDEEDEALLRAILDSHTPTGEAQPAICSYHALRHRHVGKDHWVDFHLVVPASWNVAEGHEAATAIEIELQQGLGGPDPEVPGNARATAHVEPCRAPDCNRCRNSV
jgi:divalent metal cation (Fe/Co/Zn/Cd) transporter